MGKNDVSLQAESHGKDTPLIRTKIHLPQCRCPEVYLGQFTVTSLKQHVPPADAWCQPAKGARLVSDRIEIPKEQSEDRFWGLGDKNKRLIQLAGLGGLDALLKQGN